MKHIVITTVVAAVACSTAASQDSMTGIGDVRLKGMLGARLNAMVEHCVVGVDIDYITAPFLSKNERQSRWQTEFWGKWMHYAPLYAAYSGSSRLRASVEQALDSILSSQEPSGYIGNYPDELRCGGGWDVWGMKYTMMGLMHYYDFEKGRSKKGEGIS